MDSNADTPTPPAVVHVDLDGAKHIFANNVWNILGRFSARSNNV